MTKLYALLEICIADDIQNERLQLSSNVEENAVAPKCCHLSFPPETPVMCYTFKISCVTECVDENEIQTDIIETCRALLHGSK